MNNFLKLMGRIAVAALTLLATASWAQGSPGVLDREILLGQSASFTGSFASQATSYRDGALAYFEHINAKGGVAGRKIRLVSLDDAYVVDKAKANTEQLLNKDKVMALFGYTWTNTVKATIPVAEAAAVPMFAPYTGYEELYAKHSPYVFTTRASFSDELGQIVQHLRTIGLTRIGLLHYDSVSGKELLAETQARMTAAGLTLQAIGSMKTTSKDPAAAIEALKGVDLQALIIGASGSDAVAFVREFEKVREGKTQYYARSLVGDRVGPARGGHLHQPNRTQPAQEQVGGGGVPAGVGQVQPPGQTRLHRLGRHDGCQGDGGGTAPRWGHAQPRKFDASAGPHV
jgi:ABC-type branched-subunit amino acid transport system substrate-binding protein